MSQKKSNGDPRSESKRETPQDKPAADRPKTEREQAASVHQQTTRPMTPVEAGEAEQTIPEIDEGPRPGPVDEIQEAIFEAAQAGLPTEVEFNELADPVPEVDEGPRPGPVDEVQEAIFSAAQAGLPTEVDLDALPQPSPPITQKVVRFKPKPPASAPAEEPALDETPVPDEAASLDEAPQPEPVPELPEPASLPTGTDFGLLLALFVAFRLLALFLLRPGGFIRDWSDFDTYLGIASLSDYGLYPFLNFWLEWPPPVPWLAVGAYRLALLLPPWPDDPRLWFVLILGGVFVLFEIGNFFLIYRLARRLFQTPETINRILWLYAGLFAPVYAMLGFFDGVALFFILLALDLLLDDRRFPSAVAVGGGFMVKLIPGLALPVALRRLWYQHRESNREAGIEAGLYAVAFGLTAIVLLGPFLLGGPQWVMASIRSMMSRASWETVWAVMEGYYGFGVVLGDRLNPDEVNFAVHTGWPSGVWWTITLAFTALYAFIFTRPANYNRPRNVVALTGLTVTVFMLYSKGYSPQFLVYLLPFILLLMPNGRGLTYALILTGLNVLEQPIYFVLLPDQSWLLIFTVVARLLVTAVVATEFALVLWPAPEQSTALITARRYAPSVLGSLAVLSLVALTPLTLRAYAAKQLNNSPTEIFTGFMKAQVSESDDPAKPRLLLNEQAVYRRLYPHLRRQFDLQLSDGPDKNFSGAATTADLLRGLDRVWILPTGPKHTTLTNAVAARGSKLADYNFEGLGTASLYSFRPNPIPVIPPARFTGGIDLLAHRVELESGAALLTLYWRAGSVQTQNLTVFTQLLNEAGEQVAGHDSIPRNGAAPVTNWLTGAVQADPHRIELPSDLPPGEYTIIVGLYNNFNERIHSIGPDGLGHTNRAVPLEVVGLE